MPARRRRWDKVDRFIQLNIELRYSIQGVQVTEPRQRNNHLCADRVN